MVNRSLLFTVFNKVRAIARRNPSLYDEKRVNKALGILQSKDYYADKDYFTTTKSCTCPDHMIRQVNCKHIIAAQMKAEIDRLQAELVFDLREMSRFVEAVLQ